MYYTYAYLREDGTPYYIGKGSRYRIYRNGGRPCQRPKDKSKIIYLKQNLTEEEAFRHEIYMISVFGRIDLGTGILYNKTNGGEGMSGYKFSEESKQKMRERNLNKTHSQDTKQKMSDSRKGKKQSESWIKKRTNKLIGKKRTDEQKERISQSHIGQKPWNRGITHSEKTKKTLSKIKKGMVWWNNGIICKMSKESPGSEWIRGRIFVDKHQNE